MGGLSPMHWLIVIAVLAVLFGAKRLPDAARGLGRSMRIFKTEITDLRDEAHPAVPSGPVVRPEPGAVRT
ncbi:MAG TPA: Sec-independent protein translocase subunit TatA [Mycobacteriales bacterium]|nr:Sec-independent protein translocase subunit TatA [Mycobacteriales bacterium]